MNKRKVASNILDIIILIEINVILILLLLKIISLFVLKRDAIFFISTSLDVVILMLGLPKILKKKKTLGKYISSKIVKDENEKINWEDITILVIILLLIGTVI